MGSETEELTGDWEVEDSDEGATTKGDLAEPCDTTTSADSEMLLPEEIVAAAVTAGGMTTTAAASDIAERYMSSLRAQSSLHVAIGDQVTNTYDAKAENGVFSVFFTAAFKDRLRKWTSGVLLAGGHSKVSESEFNAYLGLEIGMSICPMNEIAEFWSDRRFLGQPAFIETMSRNGFKQIRVVLTFHLPTVPGFDKERDPLWRCRNMMDHFQKRFAEFAVPVGVSSLDEMTVRTKARTRAKSFLPSKPDKYGVRFYAVVGWSSLYVHSVWNNSSGNRKPSTPAERFTSLFPTLRSPLRNTLDAEDRSRLTRLQQCGLRWRDTKAKRCDHQQDVDLLFPIIPTLVTHLLTHCKCSPMGKRIC
ncbi:hypothetical protein F442_15026 [Phytophthora nicotianae P10297]|uniref:PiggyBac transposable element-derived protein domain-containing protein n=1 Tax=Phytophthora nicotianae P10297 TaxID=1317064 RepID=W2YQM9_PHYNI|nr:hypothetical protein F442_15026 [Phytophthora nicotianae P10297]